MVAHTTEINVNGQPVSVPSVQVADRTVIITGRWLRMASVHQEDWMEDEPVPQPEAFVSALERANPPADIFSFRPRLPCGNHTCAYRVENDNLAVIPITTYDEWWQKRISRKTRQEIARAQRLGVSVRTIPWDEGLARGIVRLFERIPSKQGRPFAHYRKNFETVVREVSTYLDRSVFLGAYLGEDLIGYLKIVFMGRSGRILNIVCDESHFDKRPANALMARAVEVCAGKGVQYLVYGKFTYGNKTNDSLAEFKRRNGFEKVSVPRYYVPLSVRGTVALRLGLHRPLLDVLPAAAISFFLGCRSALYHRVLRPCASCFPRVLKRGYGHAGQ